MYTQTPKYGERDDLVATAEAIVAAPADVGGRRRLAFFAFYLCYITNLLHFVLSPPKINDRHRPGGPSTCATGVTCFLFVSRNRLLERIVADLPRLCSSLLGLS